MSTGTRTYDGSRRRASAAETRGRIIAAAGGLFSARGWAGTSVRDVAREAGVAVETVYATVGSKADLLHAAIDVAVVGDGEEVPLAERPEFLALADGDLRERVDAGARLVVAMSVRTARVVRALSAAAEAEPALAVLRDELRQRQRRSYADGLAMVARRPVSLREAETLIALVGEGTYLVLADDFGWSESRIVALVATTVMQVLELEEEES